MILFETKPKVASICGAKLIQRSTQMTLYKNLVYYKIDIYHIRPVSVDFSRQEEM